MSDTQPKWTRLGREDAYDILDRLAGLRDAVVFSRDATEISVRTLPFYETFKLYRLINFATMPTFSLSYLGDGVTFFQLDGTPLPIYGANAQAAPNLTAETAVAYLDFFFSCVEGSEGDVFLIKDPEKMPFLQALSAAQKQGVIETFKPLEVKETQEPPGVLVRATLYYGGGLLEAAIRITPGGVIQFEEQKLLLSGIYIPYSPYSQPWLQE